MVNTQYPFIPLCGFVTHRLAKAPAAVNCLIDIDEERKAELRAELDAFFARAYGLSRDELRYVLDPADVLGEDYPSETFRVLKEKEIKLYGEYRTRRLVLEAWDRMEGEGVFEKLGV
jgi:hypothetical protein